MKRWVLGSVALVILLSVLPAFGATLNWTDNSTNELGFNVQRKVSLQGCLGTEAWADLASVGVNIGTYADTTTVEGNRYAYQVRAWNTTDGTQTGTKQYSAWSNCADKAYPYTAASAPGTLAMNAGVLTWQDKTSTETGFKVERKVAACAAAGTFSTLAQVNANVVTYTDTAITAGITYCYQVKATNALGDSPASNQVEYFSAIPAPAAPSGLTID